MAFEAVVSEKNQSIILKNNSTGTFAEIFFFGVLLNKFSIYRNGNEINVIDGFEDCNDAMQNITNGFKSAKLSPFVCRMKNGEYFFENKKYKITKFYLEEHAIHGLLYDAIFDIKNTGSDDACAFAVLQYHYKKDNDGFPFYFEAEITYLLEKENSLTVRTKITNTGNINFPLSDGWHPYFKLGEKVNDLRMQINSNQMAEFDKSLLPTEKNLSYKKFQSPEFLGETFLDNCFVLSPNAQPSCILTDEVSGIELKILPDKSYPYLQIYTPEHRKSIAIENLSSLPDAFNNGTGLVIAKPGETYQFKTTYQINLL